MANLALQDSLIAGVVHPGLWVKVVWNGDGVTAFVSSAQSDSSGIFLITAAGLKAGKYTVFTSPNAVQPAVGDPSWTATGRTSFDVSPIDDTGKATFPGDVDMSAASSIILPNGKVSEDALALSSFVPADYALKAWTFDPVMWASGFVLTPAGTIFWQRIHIRKAITVGSLVMFINSAGVGLVAGQCFGLLYGPSPTFSLLGWTSDQSTNWQSTGYKAMALNSPTIAVPVGDVFSAVYYNGTTGPGFGRAGGSNIINGISTAAVTRFGTAQTGNTTVAPGALAGMAAFNAALWAALA